MAYLLQLSSLAGWAMINLLIADTSFLRAQSLATFLELSNPSFQTYVANERRDFDDLCKNIHPKFVICSVDFIKNLDFSTRRHDFCMITFSEDTEQINAENSSKHYFLQNASSKKIVSHIHEILRGACPEPDNTPRHSQKNYVDFKSLTKRERTVLSYLIKGLSNKEIARYINIQVATVKLHVRGICKKLSASNRTQAVLIAIQGEWENI